MREQAISVGVDGIQVSNHGGRQFEAAPAAIDVLPAIARGGDAKATMLFDGGVRSGLDVLRALALRRQGAPSRAGRSSTASAALGDEGADYVIDLLIDEIRTAVRQAGLQTVADAALAGPVIPGALQF